LTPDRAIEPPQTERKPARPPAKHPGPREDDLEEVKPGPAPAEQPGEEEAPGPRDLGPIHARIVKEQEQREAMERAKMWAEMRHRERLAGIEEQKPEVKPARETSVRVPSLKTVLKVFAAAAVLLLIGGGGYYLFFMQHDFKVTALDAWDEYSRDTPAANQKYKGKFVQITGKVKVYSEPGKSTHLFFEGPEGAKWGIEFTLRANDMQEVKDGDEITVRCRFGTRREPDGNLLLSNCTLLNRK
jgi:hypothetical protein